MQPPLEKLRIVGQEQVRSRGGGTSNVNGIRSLQADPAAHPAERLHTTSVKGQEREPHLFNCRPGGTSRIASRSPASHNFTQSKTACREHIAASIRPLQNLPDLGCKFVIVFQQVDEKHRIPEDTAQAASPSSDRTHRMKPSAPPCAAISSFIKPRSFSVRRNARSLGVSSYPLPEVDLSSCLPPATVK
jgi:hypothetical protein